MSSVLEYVRKGFESGLKDLDSGGQNLFSARRSYRLKVYSEFLDHLFEEKKEVLEEYTDYLFSDDIVDNSDRDSARLASKEQRSNLPDRCVLCKGSISEYHHIVPHSAGGSTAEYNLVPLCSSCHRCLGFSEMIAVEMLEEAANQFF